MNTVKIKFDDFFNNVVCNNVEKKDRDIIVRFGFKPKDDRCFAESFTYSFDEFHRWNGDMFPKFETQKEAFKAHIKNVVVTLQKDDKCVRVNPPLFKESKKENEIYYTVIID